MPPMMTMKIIATTQLRSKPVVTVMNKRRHETDAAGKSAAGGGRHIGDEAIAPDIDADAGGGDVVVAHTEHAEPSGECRSA